MRPLHRRARPSIPSWLSRRASRSILLRSDRPSHRARRRHGLFEWLEDRTLLSSLPTVTTAAAVSVTATGATLHATVNPAGTTATAFFQYSTDPSFSPTVPTVVGSGFSQPIGVAVDGSGDIFVADAGSSTVVEILPDGTSRPYGSGFNQPQGVAVDAYGDVFVADTENGAVKEVRPDGSIITVGSGFNEPISVAVDAAGNIYVGDSGNHTLTRLSTDGSVKTLGVSAPTGIAVDNWGDIFVADPSDSFLIKLLPNFTVFAIYTGFDPLGAAVDGSGNIYVADSDNGSVTEILADGTRRILKSGFVEPTGVAVDAAGDVFVVDPFSTHVLELSPPTAAAAPSPLTGTTATAVAATLTGLTPGTTYYYRAVANNPAGVVGATESFTTAMLPATQLQVQSPGSSVYGQPVTFTATVSPVAPGGGSPTGTVSFYDGSNLIARGTLGSGLNAPGTYAFSIASLPAGSYTITATYSGDSAYSGTTSSFTFQVAAVGTTVALASSANPSRVNQPVTFIARVSPVVPGTIAPDTGAVQFAVDDLLVGFPVPVVDGVATLTLSSLAPGSHAITAAFVNPGPNYESSSGTLSPAESILAGTATTLAATSSSAVYGQTEFFTAAVSDLDGSAVPSGTVDFYVDGVLAQSVALANGRAVYTTSTLPASGSPHLVYASFIPAGAFFESDSSETPLAITVSPARSTATLGAYNASSYVSQPNAIPVSVTVNAPSTAVPTGLVDFYLNGGTSVWQTAGISNGVATLNLATLPAGTYSITAAYDGNGNVAPSPRTGAATVTITQAATMTVLNTVPATTVYGTTLTLSASVSSPYTGAPITGQVQFYDGTKPLGSPVVVSGGVATLNLSSVALDAGPHAISARYLGSTIFQASDPTAAQTINVNPATTSITAGITTTNGGVSFSGTVVNNDTAVIPVGTVQILKGNRVLATARVTTSGTWTITVLSSPVQGRVTFQYLADVNPSGFTNFADSTTDMTISNSKTGKNGK